MYRKLCPLLLTIAAILVVVLVAPSTVSADHPVCGADFHDMDGDGISDAVDNCIEVPNGPALYVGFCNSQMDADSDGFGNPCDTDTDNDGGTSLADLIGIINLLQVNAYDPAFDFNCDGGVGISDFMILHAHYVNGFTPPGPSGLECAGEDGCASATSSGLPVP